VCKIKLLHRNWTDDDRDKLQETPLFQYLTLQTFNFEVCIEKRIILNKALLCKHDMQYLANIIVLACYELIAVIAKKMPLLKQLNGSYVIWNCHNNNSKINRSINNHKKCYIKFINIKLQLVCPPSPKKLVATLFH